MAGTLGQRRGALRGEGAKSDPRRLTSDAGKREKREFSGVLSRISNGFSATPLAAGTDDARVQFWDRAGQSQYRMARALLSDVGQRLGEMRELQHCGTCAVGYNS